MSHLLNAWRFCLTLLLTGALVLPAAGQSFRAFVKAGDEAWQKGDHYAAMQHYRSALLRKSDAVGVKYQYAEAARHFFSLDTAAMYYQQVVTDAPGQFPQALYHLAEVRKYQGRYEEAAAGFERYLLSRFRNKAYAARAREEVKFCRWARDQEPDSTLSVQQLSRRINTPYSEFGSFVQGDTLYYTSHRFDYEEDTHRPPRKISKVLYSRGSGRGRALTRNFNAKDQLTAHAAVAPDGNRIYFTLCRYQNSSAIRCEIYYRDKDGRGRWARQAKRLPNAINAPGCTTTQPHVAYDSSLQSTVLYFASDRPGGKGGMDLWYAAFNQEKDAFEEPRPLIDLNTDRDELTPFFHGPSQTLYFSSDGYPGFGAYDIFRAESAAGASWGAVENLGAPINSSFNDIYFFLMPDARSGYLSSNRPGSFFLDEENQACCNDLFLVSFPRPEPTADTTIREIAETPPAPPPQPPVVETPPEVLEDFLPLALYFDNDEPDRRTRRTTTRKTYGETFRQYYDRKEAYLSQYTAPLSDEHRPAAEDNIDSFFEEEVRKGHEYLLLFSEILLERLQQGETVEVFIRGYTSPRAKSDYNLALGRRRISSVRNHFDAYRDGVFRPFLADGRLVITERSFGETQAASTVSDDLANERASIYSPDAARERRVEIEEIQRGNN